MTTITYKNYIATLSFDEDNHMFHGEVINLRSVITFQGRSITELKAAFADSIEDYLEWCAQRNKTPEKPFSGKLALRLTPELHRHVAGAAARAGCSINSFIANQLQGV